MDSGRVGRCRVVHGGGRRYYVVDRYLETVRERRRNEPDKNKKLEAEIRRVTRERDNLVTACAQGHAPASILNEIHRREQGIAALEKELASLPHRLKYDPKELGDLKAGTRQLSRCPANWPGSTNLRSRHAY